MSRVIVSNFADSSLLTLSFAHVEEVSSEFLSRVLGGGPVDELLAKPIVGGLNGFQQLNQGVALPPPQPVPLVQAIGAIVAAAASAAIDAAGLKVNVQNLIQEPIYIPNQ
jgi:hypothetical protein